MKTMGKFNSPGKRKILLNFLTILLTEHKLLLIELILEEFLIGIFTMLEIL